MLLIVIEKELGQREGREWVSEREGGREGGRDRSKERKLSSWKNCLETENGSTPFKSSRPVVLNLFLGGDTHFENERLATLLVYQKQRKMAWPNYFCITSAEVFRSRSFEANFWLWKSKSKFQSWNMQIRTLKIFEFLFVVYQSLFPSIFQSKKNLTLFYAKKNTIN